MRSVAGAAIRGAYAESHVDCCWSWLAWERPSREWRAGLAPASAGRLVWNLFSARLFDRLGRTRRQVALDAAVGYQPDECHGDVHRQAEPAVDERQPDPEAVQER